MVTMNVKGVSCVGDMCQRFEALCVDVDEPIYEDTFIYVGNQMRTVGESVTKFYSEVMQNLVDSSSLHSAKDKDDPVTVAHNGDAAISKQQKLDNDGKAEKTRSADGVTTVKNYLNSRQEQKPRLKSFSDSSGKYSEEDFTYSGRWNIRDETVRVCGDINSTKDSSVKDRGSNENKPGSSGDIMEGYVSDIAVKGSLSKGVSVGDVYTELDRTSNQGCLKLEESCVLVDTDDHFSKSTLENVQKSYKKKIKEVFSPRKWSKPKRDQAEHYSNFYKQLGDTSLSTCMKHSESQKSPISEPSDFEWEIL